MYIDWILFLISVCLTLWSFFSILFEWDSSDLADFYSVWAGISIGCSVVVTFVLLCVHKGFKKTLDHWSYQCWVSLLYARSCHVWVVSLTNQRVIQMCGLPLTLGAPLSINASCPCPVTVVGRHSLPFLTTSDDFGTCTDWFEEDRPLLKWVMKWESLIFAALIIHLSFMTMVFLEEKKIVCSALFSVDIVACLSVALIPIVPTGHYSPYQLGGTVRFLGLMHAIVPMEAQIRTKQVVGFLIVLKLVFIALTGAAAMFVAEKPCLSMHANCDEGFDDFGNTVYFIFVTLSTVGYGDMSPKTALGKGVIVVIILTSISYLPSVISDILEMCRQSPLHGRLDEMHETMRQVGFFMHGGTESKYSQNQLKRALKRRKKRTRPRLSE